VTAHAHSHSHAPLAVRRATEDDLEAVVELRLALLREYADHPVYSRLRDDASLRALPLFLAQLTAPGETIFVAERCGRVVGLLRCVEMASSPLLEPGRYCYVSSVYVRPPERRRGVLRAMLAAADGWCAERGLDEMRLHNSASSDVARQAWSALGFEVIEQVRRRPLGRHHASRPAASTARRSEHADHDATHAPHHAGR
jgi:GNAT superfamily N-acetyltransferase